MESHLSLFLRVLQSKRLATNVSLLSYHEEEQQEEEMEPLMVCDFVDVIMERASRDAGALWVMPFCTWDETHMDHLHRVLVCLVRTSAGLDTYDLLYPHSNESSCSKVRKIVEERLLTFLYRYENVDEIVLVDATTVRRPMPVPTAKVLPVNTFMFFSTGEAPCKLRVTTFHHEFVVLHGLQPIPATRMLTQPDRFEVPHPYLSSKLVVRPQWRGSFEQEFDAEDMFFLPTVFAELKSSDPCVALLGLYPLEPVCSVMLTESGIEYMFRTCKKLFYLDENRFVRMKKKKEAPKKKGKRGKKITTEPSTSVPRATKPSRKRVAFDDTVIEPTRAQPPLGSDDSGSDIETDVDDEELSEDSMSSEEDGDDPFVSDASDASETE